VDCSGLIRAAKCSLQAATRQVLEVAMNAEDFVQWCRLAGLYLGNESHYARYRAYAEKISPCGVNVAIICEFLEENTPVIDLQEWRNYRVYEMGGQQKARVEMTAAALEAIGATRAASKVRTVQNTSSMHQLTQQMMNLGDKSPEELMSSMGDLKMVDLLKDLQQNVASAFPNLAGDRADSSPPPSADSDIESREEIEYLLEHYVTDNESTLQADIEKYGDPRTTPGFTVKNREKELEDLERREYSRKDQLRDIDELQMYMQTLEKRLSQGKASPKRLATLRRQILELVRTNRARPADEIIPEMEDLFETVAEFQKTHAAVFRIEPIGDPGLRKRLEEIGDYDVDVQGDDMVVNWPTPERLDCPWTKFSLELTFPKEQAKALRALLDATDRLITRFPRLSEEWRTQLIEQFRCYEQQMDDWELEDYELDENDEVTVESILGEVENGSIHVRALDNDGEEIATQTHFSIEWDPEHGYAEVDWEDEPPESEEAATATFDCGNVTLSECGPVLSNEDIAAFEKRLSVELPTAYRQFLSLHNGGRPRPNHLALKQEGVTIPIDIERFYPISGSSDRGGLEVAFESLQQQSFPAGYLPIAEIRMENYAGVPSEPQMLLCLSGKKHGHVVVVDLATLKMQLPHLEQIQQLPGMEGVLEECLQTAARGFDKLFAKLKSRPKEDLPDWLALIRCDDVDGMTAWLEGGGTLQPEYQGYGSPLPMSVTDYLTKEASIEMLGQLLQRKLIKPKQLCRSWQRYFAFDAARFDEFMPLLPREMWTIVLSSHAAWDDAERLERLADAGVDFNAAVNDEGMPPLHLAVQLGKKEAVKWLIAHGADVQKPDKYQRTAFIWAESGPGYDCLPLLEGRDETEPAGGEPSADAEGIVVLSQAAEKLPAGHGLIVSIEIKSPPVTRVEKAYYHECHYRLSIDVRGDKVTFNDMQSARQDYLHAGPWPAMLFAPILEWPDLTPLWDTIEVREFDWPKAMRKRKYEGPLREDLYDAARSALEQAFNAEEAAARGIRVRK
jgi:hypothetical protein